MTKTLAKVFGVVLLLVGVLGFFSNPIIGETGYFHANAAHNVVHLLLGIIFLLVKTEEKATFWLKVVGIVTVLVAILGFTSNTDTIFGFIETNAAANWLHAILGIVFFLSGMTGGKTIAPDSQM